MFAKTEVYWLSVLETSTFYLLYGPYLILFCRKVYWCEPLLPRFFRLLLLGILRVLPPISLDAVSKTFYIFTYNYNNKYIGR